MKFQNNNGYHSSISLLGIAVITCHVTVAIATGYNENKTSCCGKKKKKEEAWQKSTAVVWNLKD